MEVKKIVYSAAKILGMSEEVRLYFEESITDNQREAEMLLQCFNIVQQDLALDYFPLTAEDTLFSFSGRLEFSNMTHSPVRILGLKDGNGKELEYSLFPTYLQAQIGPLTVTYTYTPEDKGINEQCECGTLASELMFLYGTLAQYTLVQGLFEEAVVWDKKYKKAIEDAYSMQTSKRLKSRRWV